MFKKAILIAAVFAAGCAGLVSAQTAKPVSIKKLAHMRIVYLKDRIQNQRERIAQGLTAGTLTGDQAVISREILDSVESRMKDEHRANGSKKSISKETYEAYNAKLDANSALLKERKQYFYYYGPYADYGPYYEYYYDAYPAAGAPAPSLITMAEIHPMIYELKDRIKNQRERIQQGLTSITLTSEQAKDCGVILNTVQDDMKEDYKANGSLNLTRDQYLTFNKALDTNSKIIQENKHYFYYYDNANYNPNEDQIYTN
jgi:hypothetical protein